MLQLVHKLIDRFLLTQELRARPYELRRARLLGWIHVITVFIGAAMALVLWMMDRVVVPVVAFTLIVVVLTGLFRRFGNMILSGNLLALFIWLVLSESMLRTGGLYSDNLLWMLLVPVIAFLFTDTRWGAAWAILVVATLGGAYVAELRADVSYRYASLHFEADYYFLSYLGLFTGLFGVIVLFVRGNDNVLAELKEKKEALRREHAQVELQNERLRMQEGELTRSNRDLELFAYVASHDLKEPVRMVKAFSNLLDKSLGSSLDGADAEYLGHITTGAQRMQAMLDDLLAYSRVGRERVSDRDVDLNSIVEVVRNNLRVPLDESGGAIEAGPLPTIRAKNVQVVQVVQNLVANALKFREADRVPHVRIRQLAGTRDELGLEVADNGIGIAEKDIPKIFGVFQRLHSRAKFEGSGIGLATVRRIVDDWGGRVEVSSEVGRGTSFRIWIPADRSVAGEPLGEDTERHVIGPDLIDSHHEGGGA